MITAVNTNGHVAVLGRTPDGKRTLERKAIVPYFYVKDEDLPTVDFKTSQPIRIETGHVSVFGDRLTKLYFSSTFTKKLAKELFKTTFEADVKEPDRYMIDNVQYLGDDPLRVCYLDIEVDSIEEFPKPEEGKWPILSFAIYDSVLKAYVVFLWHKDAKRDSFKKTVGVFEKESVDVKFHLFNDEISMIKSFLAFIQASDPDMIVGWNVLNFDMQYIYNRFEKLGIPFKAFSNFGWARFDAKFGVNINGRAVADLQEAYKRFSYVFSKAGEKFIESYSLMNISKVELGLEKVHLGDNMGKMWRENFESLFEYIVTDVALMVKINEKLKLTGTLHELAKMCGGRLESICGLMNKATNTSYIVDMYMLRFAKKQGFVLPSKPAYGGDVDLAGAFVMTPPPGLHENVAVYDVASLYPSLIRTFNLSPESICKDDDSIKINGLMFSKTQRGMFPLMLDELVKVRKNYKLKAKDPALGKETNDLYNMRQDATKTILNSLYGMLGYSKCRMFKLEVANTITYAGRSILEYVAEVAKAKGLTLLYEDTDSAFIKLKETTTPLEDAEKLLDELNASIIDFVKRYNVNEHVIAFELDKIYSTLLFVEQKKAYLGWQIYNGQPVSQLHTMGFSTKRKDTPAFAKDALKDIYTMIVRDKKKREDIIEYLRKIPEVAKKENPLTLGISLRIGMNMGDYKGNAQHLRGMKYSVQHFKKNFSRMDFVRVLFIKKTANGHPHTDVITLRDDDTLPEGFEIDYSKTLNRIIYMKLQPTFEALGWGNLEELQEELAGQKKLSNFFKKLDSL